MSKASYKFGLAFILTALILLAGCGGSSGSNHQPQSMVVTPTSGSSQSTTVNESFSAPLVATVTSGGTPQSGVVVTFTAPASGASGTFAGGVNTATTNSSGIATSAAFTANSTPGTYSVVASASGATAGTFRLTNTAVAASSVSATSGSGQSATYSTQFSAPLVATVVDANSNPVSGVTVTFTPPAAGASGTFAGGVNTAVTDSNGVATSAAFSANASGGPYTVTASAPGISTPAVFSLTNTGVNYSFYLSGLESINSGPNYYAAAGAVSVDGTGNVLGGELDYNDGFGITVSGASISGGTLTADSTTGQGTLALTTGNSSLGVAGVVTLGVQFVNTKHALVVQFDGTATSSGSLDYQTVASTLNDGNYSFALSGVDTSYAPVVFGGIFTVSGSGTALSGTYDANDGGSASIGNAFSGSLSAADAYGRGTLSGTPFGTTFNYYIVTSQSGNEAIRIIDMNPSSTQHPSDAAVGSAYGQGSATFSNASLGASSVFGINGNPFGIGFAAAGMFTTTPTTPGNGTFLGIGDEDEVATSGAAGATISGTYSMASSGYGTLSITSSTLGDLNAMGVYMVNPTLNLSDPNNTTSGLGAALIINLDAAIVGSGFVMPQTDKATASFANAYAFGAQEYNNGGSGVGEFDFLGQGSVTAGALSGTGLVSDPFSYFITPSGGIDTGVTFTGTAAPDLSHLGRYTMQLDILAGVCAESQLQMAIYQASGKELVWVEGDTNATALGTLQQKGSLSGLPAVKRKGLKPAKGTRKMSVKPGC